MSADKTIYAALAQRESEVLSLLEEGEKALAPLRLELADIRRMKALRAMPVVEVVRQAGDRPASQFPHLTIKQLVLKALAQHCPNGATANELLAVIDLAYNRDLTRTSLSPQLSRLKEEGKIRVEKRRWFLDDPQGSLVERMERDDAPV